MKTKLMTLAIAAGLGLASASASAVVVSGIDFGPMGDPAVHLETMTLAQQFINPATTPAGTGAGMGYGFVTTINGNNNYCTVSAGCGLYYTVDFSGGTFVSPTEIQFTGTDVNLYLLPSFLNLQSQDSNANLAAIQAGTLYASLVGHGNLDLLLPPNVVSTASGSLSGVSINFFGSGLLDVVLGVGNAAFETFLDGDGIADAAGGFADIAYTESANNFVLNPFDIQNGLADGCSDGTAATGAWCLQGTLNTRGVAQIPEPGSLALLSLGLLAGGLIRRRKTQA